jgi:hypothetical protein
MDSGYLNSPVEKSEALVEPFARMEAIIDLS